MAFDPLEYELRSGIPLVSFHDPTKTYTTEQVVQQYFPGTVVSVFDPLYGFRIFKLVKNLNNAVLAQGDVVSYVTAASVGTITAGGTTYITTSGLTANDLEYQLILVTDDAGAAGAAPEGESGLCVKNSATRIDIHSKYAFSAAVAASDAAYVVYINGVDAAAAGDTRGPSKFTNSVAGVSMGAPADNSWFWICQKGWVTAKNTNALAAGDLKAGTGTVVAAAEDAGQELVIGHAPATIFAGNEESYACVYIDVFNSIHGQTTP